MKVFLFLLSPLLLLGCDKAKELVVGTEYEQYKGCTSKALANSISSFNALQICADKFSKPLPENDLATSKLITSSCSGQCSVFEGTVVNSSRSDFITSYKFKVVKTSTGASYTAEVGAQEIQPGESHYFGVPIPALGINQSDLAPPYGYSWSLGEVRGIPLDF